MSQNETHLTRLTKMKSSIIMEKSVKLANVMLSSLNELSYENNYL